MKLQNFWATPGGLALDPAIKQSLANACLDTFGMCLSHLRVYFQHVSAILDIREFLAWVIMSFIMWGGNIRMFNLEVFLGVIAG